MVFLSSDHGEGGGDCWGLHSMDALRIQADAHWQWSMFLYTLLKPISFFDCITKIRDDIMNSLYSTVQYSLPRQVL
jgi:hypothetical protein